MALYSFKCENCGVEFDKNILYSSVLRSSCSECGSDNTRRIFSPPAIVFRSEGFYHVDSGKRFESQLSERGKEIWNKAKQEAD